MPLNFKPIITLFLLYLQSQTLLNHSHYIWYEIIDNHDNKNVTLFGKIS